MPLNQARLEKLADTGSLEWTLETEKGGQYLRHDMGEGIEATLGDNGDNEQTALVTITRLESGEIIDCHEVYTLTQAEEFVREIDPKKCRKAGQLKKGDRFSYWSQGEKVYEVTGEIRHHDDNELLAIEYKDTCNDFCRGEAVGADVWIWIN